MLGEGAVLTQLASTEAPSGANAYFSPGQTLVVIDPSPRMRDDLARLAVSSFRVADFPDVDSSVARVSKEPAAILIGGEVAASGRIPPIERLRKHQTFSRTPVIRVGHAKAAMGAMATPDRVPDAEIALPVTSHDLVRRICGLANKTVEDDWNKLPQGPRAALGKTLSVFKGVGDLVGKGQPIEFKNVSDACTPVLDSVRQSGHGYIFEGLRNHSDAPRAVIMVAEQHHECLDGSGHPKALKNGDINDLARMAAIVDVFAAP